MPVEVPKEKWPGSVRTVTLGALPSEGGTRKRVVTVGGETAMPFMHFEGEIPYPPVASVALGFRREDVAHPLDGFGVLIPSKERRTTLGALFSSTLFEGRAPEGQVVLTAFIGGRRHDEVGDWGEARVIERVLDDLGPILGFRAQPVMTHISRWPRAIPQYELGHLERIAALDTALAGLPGLWTRANWRDGVAVSDCIRNGWALAERMAG